MIKKSFLTALLCMTVAAMYGAPVQIQAGKTNISVEFFTPSIVRVVKSPVGHEYTKRSLVVIAKELFLLVQKERRCYGKKGHVPLNRARRDLMPVPTV